MTPIGHPRKAPKRLCQLLSRCPHVLLVLVAATLLVACAGPSIERDREVPLLVVDESLPLPVEGEQIDLKAIESVIRLAKADSLLGSSLRA